MTLNTIYNQDCVCGMRERVPDESVDLVIADPPYFKVIGEKWDYSWRTEEDYLKWSESWIDEAVRTLRKGGRFICSAISGCCAACCPFWSRGGWSYGSKLSSTRGYRRCRGGRQEGQDVSQRHREYPVFIQRSQALRKKAFERKAEGAWADGKGNQ